MACSTSDLVTTGHDAVKSQCPLRMSAWTCRSSDGKADQKIAPPRRNQVTRVQSRVTHVFDTVARAVSEPAEMHSPDLT